MIQIIDGFKVWNIMYFKTFPAFGRKVRVGEKGVR